jgi:hemoglobin
MDTTKTLYESVGAENLKELVNRFYDNVQNSEIISPLFMGDFDLIKDKQYCFLTQFLGGPALYTEKYGHPRMRMRHLPHAIDQQSKIEWLACMRVAIDSLNLSDDLAEALYNCFPPVAQHMVNK